MLRATTMGAALVAAACKTPNSNWVRRAIADRAIHTSTGVVKERDIKVHLKHATAVKMGLVNK